MVQVLYQTESNSNIYINSSNTEQQHFNNNRQHSKHQQASTTAQHQQQQLQPAWTPTQCCYGALQWVLGGCVWVMRLCVWFDVVFWCWFVRVAVSQDVDSPPSTVYLYWVALFVYVSLRVFTLKFWLIVVVGVGGGCWCWCCLKDWFVRVAVFHCCWNPPLEHVFVFGPHCLFKWCCLCSP